MPTLKEYESRGVDITRMTTAQLIAEGYVTPLNELPVLIDAPGDYRTRNGRRVTIHAISPTTTLATTAYTCKGSIWQHTHREGIMTYSAWHRSGRYLSVGESGRDIVEKW